MDNRARYQELERAVTTDCRACRAVCEETLTYLDPAPREKPSELVRALVACAAAAESIATTLDEEGWAMAALLEFCAEMCDSVAEQCDGAVDVQLETCSNVCRGCADTIRTLLWGEY